MGMSRVICVVIAASIALTGCDLANKEEAHYDDSRNPYYKQAQQDLDNNNPSAAVLDYENALAADPKLVKAHYELGIIYGDKLSDPIGSIFHFKRYLELAPASDKADQVKALIDKQSQAFAASLPNSPTQSADDYAKLQAENATLKKQVDDATRTITQLQAQLAHDSKHHNAATTAIPPVTPEAASAPAAGTPVGPVASDALGSGAPASTNGAPATSPRALPVDLSAMTNAPAATDATTGPSKTYKVVSGDSLWKIAHKMYPGDTKEGIDKIKDANKDTLIEGKPLKIGQVLIIPQ
jgi:LysM repeat protein